MVHSASLLIVEDDLALASLLASEAAARGFRASHAASLPQLQPLLDRRTWEVALVDLTLGPDSGFDALRQIKERAPDVEITGVLTLQLRAERSGSGPGRIYTATIECQDAAGNVSTRDVQVRVPHDRR